LFVMARMPYRVVPVHNVRATTVSAQRPPL
jgi:hypothetical protein